MGNATNDLGTLTTEAARFAHARIKQLSTEVQELEHEQWKGNVKAEDLQY